MRPLQKRSRAVRNLKSLMAKLGGHKGYSTRYNSRLARRVRYWGHEHDRQERRFRGKNGC